MTMPEISSPPGFRCRRSIVGYSRPTSKKGFVPTLVIPDYRCSDKRWSALDGLTDSHERQLCRRISGACVPNSNMEEPAGRASWSMGKSALGWFGQTGAAGPEARRVVGSA